MNIAQIEENLTQLIGDISPDRFIYDLLLAYGTPKTTVTLLQKEKGNRNLSEKDGQIILKRRLFFQRSENNQDLHQLIDSLQSDDKTYRHDPRFIVVTDYKTLLAVDTKTEDTLDIEITDIPKHPFFFGPWAGIEKNTHYNERQADIKAAEKMAQIHDEILKQNHFAGPEDLHRLNIFLSRLLFCFFAEDTGIFASENIFTSFVSMSQRDGSDLDDHFNRLFEVLNRIDHAAYPDYLAKFPYVNGGLFGDQYFAPKFSAKARRMIIQCGELDWATINPDIFGSMFQAVVHKDQRGQMGQHYTSVPNIMKVIDPLFMDELRGQFEKYFDQPQGLEKLLKRLGTLRIFDPACGSGNFLIIAYKEIRELEMEIFQRLQEITPSWSLPLSRIQLGHFYGIELDDFAHEVAILSLWLAEHQMNMKFREIFGTGNPTLPLKEGGNIVCANATRIPWEAVCPKDKKTEIYILGNPPYLGSNIQNKEQKDALANACTGFKNYKNLDYIACWFVKGAAYIRDVEAKFAFVSTNSICQGDQVGLLWPQLLKSGVEIGFAHTSFKWTNSAKGKAGVTCVIIGLRNESTAPKYIFTDRDKITAQNINPYLIDGRDIFLPRRNQALSKIPPMLMGNKATDGGHFILTPEEKDHLLSEYPEAAEFLKHYMGGQEFIKGIERWCLWIDDQTKEKALTIPEIKARLEKVKQFRLASKAASTRAAAKKSHRFIQIQHEPAKALIVPATSSERRNYIPIGFLDENCVICNAMLAIWNAEPWVFSILTSRLHMAWVKTTAGGLESRIGYSSTLCYNTFPLPKLTKAQKTTLTHHTYHVLGAREQHPEKTMAELYDPDKMPDQLRAAHHDLDLAVERCYRSKPFAGDEERLEYLFKFYEELTAKETKGDYYHVLA